jgi:hypothetical protein
MTTAEAAIRLNLSENQVRKRLQDGTLVGWKEHGRWEITHASVEKLEDRMWLRQQQGRSRIKRTN